MFPRAVGENIYRIVQGDRWDRLHRACRRCLLLEGRDLSPRGRSRKRCVNAAFITRCCPMFMPPACCLVLIFGLVRFGFCFTCSGCPWFFVSAQVQLQTTEAMSYQYHIYNSMTAVHLLCGRTRRRNRSVEYFSWMPDPDIFCFVRDTTAI